MVTIITQIRMMSTMHLVKSSWIIILRVTIPASSLMVKQELERVTLWFDFPKDIRLCQENQGCSADKLFLAKMGTPDHPGLIPRTCRDLFERIDSNNSPSVNYSVRVSYFEVYNEHVRDLLVPRRDMPYYLKVRESPTEGPYIKDLIEVPVRNISEILKWMKMGDNNRTIASTKMNDTSSRSHAVFTLVLKQIHHDMDTDETTERVARIRQVSSLGFEG